MLEACGGDKRGTGSLALEQRIGGNGRPVREPVDTACGAGRARGGDDRLLLVRSGENLGRGDTTAVEHDRVGEGPAHVDAEHSHSGRLTAWQSAGSSSTSTACSSTPRLPHGSSGRSFTASTVTSCRKIGGPPSSERSAPPSIHSDIWRSSSAGVSTSRR